MLGDKSQSYIEENFNYVVEMFDAGEEEKTTGLVAEAKQNAFSRNVKVPTPVISESNTSSNQSGALVGGYLSELKKSEGYAKK